MSLQFQGQASLFSEWSSIVRDTLIHSGDQYTTRSILATAPLEDIDRQVYRKPDFMFGDATPDPNHQLQAGEGQWIFQLGDETTFFFVFLPVCDAGSEDGMGCEPKYRLCPHREIDASIS